MAEGEGGGGGKRPRQTITVKGEKFEIEGLGAFTRALRAISDEYPRALKDANFNLANEVVLRARDRAAQQPGVARRAAKSLTATKSMRESAVRGGGARAPYFFGAEFGSLRYAQFQRWRGNQFTDDMPGYFLHPTIREDGPELLENYLSELDEIHKQAFPEE